MPHQPKHDAGKADERLEMPENILPGDPYEGQEWRPSDAAKLPPLGSISSHEVLDEADDEWRPSDSVPS